MTIKIEFPAGDARAARVFACALNEYAAGKTDYEQFATGTVETCTPTVTADDQQEQHASDNDFTGEPAGDRDNEPAAVDHNDVAFNPEFCGQSAEPFYASGPRAGQWKKKRGVDQDDYDAWYASQLPANDDQPAPDSQVDTATAFGGEPDQPAAQSQAPRTCGEFMAWVSEQQVAGHLNSDDITNAYAAEGLQITDLFPPNDEQTVADRISKLYARLNGNV